MPTLAPPRPCPVSLPSSIDLRRSLGVHLDSSLLRGCAPPAGQPRDRFVRSDTALRWLMASDRLVGDEVARALVEVKEGRLYHAHGHARWSAYLSAFVPLTSRWAQQEMKRVRALAEYPGLAADYEQGVISRSHLRVVLRVVTPETETLWRERTASMTVRQLELAAGEARRIGEEKACEEGGPVPCAEPDHSDEASPARARVVTAPPAVAGLLAQAVELARRVEGYQIGVGQAVAIMAMETAAGASPPALRPDPINSRPRGNTRRGTARRPPGGRLASASARPRAPGARPGLAPDGPDACFPRAPVAGVPTTRRTEPAEGVADRAWCRPRGATGEGARGGRGARGSRNPDLRQGLVRRGVRVLR